MEHKRQGLACAEQLTDPGAEWGDAGGAIVFEGTPEALVASGVGHTAHFLKAVMGRD